MRRYLLLLPFLLSLAGTPSKAQQWAGILSPSRAVDWSGAGSSAISTTRAQCVTAACATVSGGTVTTASLNSAVASAPANSYVLLPAGSFTLSGGVSLIGKSNITIRGAGANSTFLTFTGANGCYSLGAATGADFCVASSDVSYWQAPSNVATWSGGYAKGSSTITLSAVPNLKIGQPIILDQLDDTSDNGAAYVGCEVSGGTCYSGSFPGGYERGNTGATIRGQQQIVTVTSCGGVSTAGASCSGTNVSVGISPGLYAPNWRSSQSPQAWWATSPVYNDGIEDLSMTSSGGAGVQFFNCQGCWVKGVRSVLTSTAPQGWTHVGAYISNHVTVRDSYFYGYDGDAYSVGAFLASDLLWENNIFQRTQAAEIYASDCEGCVNAYNYSTNPVYSSASGWQSSSFFYHSLNLFSLAEGNVGVELYSDSTHGTHNFNTIFRNRLDGFESNNGTMPSSNTIAVRLNPKTRYQNVIGNVLGTTGRHTNYQAVPSSSGSQYTSVFSIGLYPEGSEANDQLVQDTLMRWGNYDTVNAAVRFVAAEVPSGVGTYANPVPSSQTLPASFYLSSKPVWWPITKAWPPIGPDVTGGNIASTGGFAYTIPAQDCYLNKMAGPATGVGSALPFDASFCYGSGVVTGLIPPDKVTAVPH